MIRNLAITAFCLFLVVSMTSAAESSPSQAITSSAAISQITLPPPPNTPDMQQLAQRLYDLSLQEKLPLSEDQIRQLIDRMKKTSEAMRPLSPPTIESRTERIMLRPGFPTPTIRIVPGYVTTLLFIDSTGAPWPLTSLSNGNKNWFEVVQPELPDGNILTISALARNADTNITVTLANETLPVIVRLKTDDRQDNPVADGLVSMQITKQGPKATEPVLGKKPESVINPTMQSFLDGIPPAGAKQIVIHPARADVDLWQYQDSYFLRSRYNAVWPAWSSVSSSAGGFCVYQMPVVPLIMLSMDGSTETLTIGDEQ